MHEIIERLIRIERQIKEESLKFNINSHVALLVSSLAAAHSVETIGNKHTISKLKILKTLENILK